MTNRYVVGGAALVVGLALGWAVHGLAGYDKNAETVTSFDDWRVLCPAAAAAEQHCQIEQDTVDTKTRSPVARLAIASDKDKLVLLATLPLGVALEQGTNYSFGTDTPTPMAYRVCTAAGCIAEAPLDAKIQAGFDGGKDGKLVFVFAANNKPVQVPISLKGFATAQRAYRSAEAKRGAWFWRML
jgi:invasion protein IalB